MSNVIVNGIVLTSMPIGEYDRRLEILTDTYGRISAFATGSRRPSSDIGAPSRVFAFGKFELHQGKNSYSLRSAKISEYFTSLSQDIDITYYGFYFLELCRYFSRENVEAKDMLALCYFALKALEKGVIEKELVRAVFELKMLEINGICPAADDIISPDGPFSIKEDLDPSAAYAIRFVLAESVGKTFSFKLTDNVRSQFVEAVNLLMRRQVDHKFNSLEFLDFLA